MVPIARALLTLAYPVLIMLALSWFEPRGVALVLLGLLGLRFIWLPTATAALLVPIVLVGVVAIATAVWNDPVGLLAAPVLVNLALLVSFAASLRSEPIVERLARLQVDRLSAAEVRYCRRVTWIWCGFFVVNGAVALALALRRDLAAWTFYTGFLAYVLMGVLFSIEYVYRHARFRRYVGAATDPLLRWLFPPRLAHEVALVDASRRAERRRVHLEVPMGLACWPGHFPGEPMLPGVVQVDWALREIERWRGRRAPLASIEGLKFKRPVLPGDELVLDLEAVIEERSRAGPGADQVVFSYRRGDEMISQGRLSYAEPGSSRPSPVAGPGAGGFGDAYARGAIAWPEPAVLLPHAGLMVWLRSVEGHDARETACLVAVSDLGVFRDPDGGVGAHVALEWMAQCVSAHDGLERRERGAAPSLGLLLGSKRLRFARAAYNRDECFRVVAVRGWGGDQGPASFDCRVESLATGMCVAEARLSCFVREDGLGTPSILMTELVRGGSGMGRPSEAGRVGSQISSGQGR